MATKMDKRNVIAQTDIFSVKVDMSSAKSAMSVDHPSIAIKREFSSATNVKQWIEDSFRKASSKKYHGVTAPDDLRGLVASKIFPDIQKMKRAYDNEIKKSRPSSTITDYSSAYIKLGIILESKEYKLVARIKAGSKHYGSDHVVKFTVKKEWDYR